MENLCSVMNPTLGLDTSHKEPMQSDKLGLIENGLNDHAYNMYTTKKEHTISLRIRPH